MRVPNLPNHLGSQSPRFRNMIELIMLIFLVTGKVKLICRLIFGLFALVLSSPAPAAEGAVEVAGQVGRIVDGDTFRLGGVKIRPAGFDAPEIRQKCLDERAREYACGERTLAALAALIRGKMMVCTTTGKRSYGALWLVALSRARTSGGRWLKVAGRLWTHDSASRTCPRKRRHVPSAGGCGQGRLSFPGNGGGESGEEVNIDGD